ncbi:Gamma1-adaptin brefeldin A resistance protein [Heterocephalus glaber]|uniref:Gamma1-adaptin brefeldin A resistance protein n=1 Tax=Heterocephalus glaber TaxID=10181 RepID=G5BME3_HETGA|nr:Gamma1-adaptin brefeldin A resistance protein [Heterocephalus glaber]
MRVQAELHGAHPDLGRVGPKLDSVSASRSADLTTDRDVCAPTPPGGAAPPARTGRDPRTRPAERRTPSADSTALVYGPDRTSDPAGGNVALPQGLAQRRDRDVAVGRLLQCGDRTEAKEGDVRPQITTVTLTGSEDNANQELIIATTLDGLNQFENLVESDEGESPGSSHRPLTEEEIVDLRERHYDSIAEKQKDLDRKIQKELALQEETLRLEEEALYAAQREAARAAKQRKLTESASRGAVFTPRLHSSLWVLRDLRHTIRRAAGLPSQSLPCGNLALARRLAAVNRCRALLCEASLPLTLTGSRVAACFISALQSGPGTGLSSDATALTPNTESSSDLMTKTRSTSGNDDNTSLDLEWEDEEGMNRMLPVRERSKTEEDILRAALTSSSRKTGSNPTSTSEDSNGLEWENDFVSAEVDDNGNSEYSGFVNPVFELSDSGIKQSDAHQQIR